MTQPGQQFVSVRSSENGVQRIATVLSRIACGDAEQVQIVIAQNGNGRLTQPFDEAQAFERCRSAIYQVTHEPESILRSVEVQLFQQAQQLVIAALQIADCVGRHSIILTGVEKAAQKRRSADRRLLLAIRFTWPSRSGNPLPPSHHRPEAQCCLPWAASHPCP